MGGPVFRLKSIWSKLSEQVKLDFDYLKTKVCHPFPNSQFYRNIFHQGLGSSQIPHVAVVLKDCFLLEEIPTIENGLVNFHKYIKQYNQLRDFFQTQALVDKMLVRKTDLTRC